MPTLKACSACGSSPKKTERGASPVRQSVPVAHPVILSQSEFPHWSTDRIVFELAKRRIPPHRGRCGSSLECIQAIATHATLAVPEKSDSLEAADRGQGTRGLIEAMRVMGYLVSIQGITCDIEEAQRRNLERGDDNISCYYAERYQRRWLLEAAHAVQHDPPQSAANATVFK